MSRPFLGRQTGPIGEVALRRPRRSKGLRVHGNAAFLVLGLATCDHDLWASACYPYRLPAPEAASRMGYLGQPSMERHRMLPLRNKGSGDARGNSYSARSEVASRLGKRAFGQGDLYGVISHRHPREWHRSDEGRKEGRRQHSSGRRQDPATATAGRNQISPLKDASFDAGTSLFVAIAFRHTIRPSCPKTRCILIPLHSLQMLWQPSRPAQRAKRKPMRTGRTGTGL